MVVLGSLLVASANSYGYLDPGAGSYGFQLVIAGLTALMFAFSSLKARILDGFRRAFRLNPKDSGIPEAVDRVEGDTDATAGEK